MKLKVFEKSKFRSLWSDWSYNLHVSSIHWEKNAIESIVFLSENMYITDSNQYAIESVTYLLVLVVYFYEFIVYMLFERNAFDSIKFLSQCRIINFYT